MKMVFVSSTFKDMQFERDKLNTYVVPLIDESISQYGEQIFFGDLRWGVNTTQLDENESGKKVLDVCLDEIDNCKPYMIVLIGERYGWIPSQQLIKQAAITKGITIGDDDISVTQLEIEYGALLNPDYEGRILFYFRNLNKDEMSEDDKKDYEAESLLHRQKLELLKEKIKEKYPNYVRYYDAKWDNEKKEVVNLEPLMEMIINDLNNIFINDINKDNNIPWQEKALKSAHKYYIERAKDYYPITTYDKKELIGALVNKQTYVSFIEGKPGSGKTAFLSNCYSYLYNKSNDNIIFVPFVCQLDKYSNDTYNFFKILLYKLEEALDLPHQQIEVTSEYKLDIIDKVIELIKHVNGNVLCFIDNCDEILLTMIFQFLYNSFSNDLSSYIDIESDFDNLFFYVAYSSNEPDIIVPPNYNFARTYKMLDIDDENKVPFIKNLIKRKHKELPDDVINHIANKKESQIVLYDKLIVDRLLLLDSQDFTNIRNLGDGMENINKYMISIIDNLADDVESIIQELVKEAAERINKDFVYRLCGVFIYSTIGLSQLEIIDIFKFNNWEFNQLNFSIAVKTLSTFIEYHKLNGYYKIRNIYMIKAIKELLEKNNYKYVCDNLCDYMESLDDENIIKDRHLRIAAYRNDCEYFAKILLEKIKKDEYLYKDIYWMLEHCGAKETADFIVSLVKQYPKIDFSTLVYKIPTTCLFDKEYHMFIQFLSEILYHIDIDKRKLNDKNYNSIVFLSLYKMVMLFKNNVSFSSAYIWWESNGLYDFEKYKMNEITRILIYKLNIEMSIGICNIDSTVEYLYEGIDVIKNIRFNQESAYQNFLLKGHILFELCKNYHDEYADDRYYECLNSYYEVDRNSLISESLLTVDDFKSIIDAYLFKTKDDDDPESSETNISNALYYLNWGYELFGNRMLMCLPNIYTSINHHMSNINQFSDDVNKVIPYLKKQVAYRTESLNDYVEAIRENGLYLRTFAGEYEEEYGEYFLEIYDILIDFYSQLKYSFDSCFLRVFYDTCYILCILHRSGLQERIDYILSLIERIDEKEVVFSKDIFAIFKSFILCFFKENIDLKEAKQFERNYDKKIRSSKYESEIKIYQLECDFIEEALQDYNFKDNYDFSELVDVEEFEDDE